jgi:putative oxidoreductase
VYVGEVVAPIMILAGVGTRIAGLIVAFDMLVAIGLVQSTRVFALTEMGGAWAIELEMFYLLTGLSLAFLGGGRLGFSKGGGKWD